MAGPRQGVSRGIGRYASGGYVRQVSPYPGDPLEYGFGPEHQFFSNNTLPTVNLPPLTAEEAGLGGTPGTTPAPGNDAADVVGGLIAGGTGAVILDKLTGGILSDAIGGGLKGLLGLGGAGAPFVNEAGELVWPDGTKYPGPPLPKPDIPPEVLFEDASDTFGDPNEGMGGGGAGPSFGYGGDLPSPNILDPDLRLDPDNYGFGQDVHTFEDAPAQTSSSFWFAGDPLEDPGNLFDFGLEWLDDSFGLDDEAIEGAGEIATDALTGESGSGSPFGGIDDFLQSPWFAGPAAAFAFYNAFRDPSGGNLAGAATSGLNLAGSLGMLGEGFSALPFLPVTLAAALGPILDPGKNTGTATISIDPSGKPVFGGYTPGEHLDRIKALTQGVLEDLSQREGLVPLMGHADRNPQDYVSATNPYGMYDPAHPEQIDTPATFQIVPNFDDPSQVAVIVNLPYFNTYTPHQVYKGPADAKKIADVIASANVLQGESGGWLDQWQAGREGLDPADNRQAEGGPIGASPAGQMPGPQGPVRGPGGGQDDPIPALLSDGEHVLDADTVAMIGDGSNDEGHRRLEGFKHSLRQEKRSAPAGSIPPKAKGIGTYFRASPQSARKAG